IEEDVYLRPAHDLRGAERIRFWTHRPVPQAERVVVELETGEMRGGNAAGAALFEVKECPECGTETENAWKAFVAPASLALSILAETALAELPEYPGR